MGSLKDICIKYIRENLSQVFFTTTISTNDSARYKIKPDIVLPPYLFDEIVTDDYKSKMSFAHIYPCIVDCKQLRSIRLQDNGVVSVSKSAVGSIRPTKVALDVSCKFGFLDKLAIIGNDLVSLEITVKRSKREFILQGILNDCEASGILKCPNLIKISLDCSVRDYLSKIDLYCCSDKIRILNLISCKLDNVKLKVISELKNIESLSLFDARFEGIDIRDVLSSLCGLITLRSLDLSKHCWTPYAVETKDLMMRLMSSLKNLRKLEIGATDLPGTGYLINGNVPKIEWLEGRQLDYIGLLNCPCDPCKWPNIRADSIAGNANLEQKLVSLEEYIEKSQLFASAITNITEEDLSNLTEDKQRRLLQAVFRGLDRYRSKRAFFEYIVNQVINKIELDIFAKKVLLDVLVSSKEGYLFDNILCTLNPLSNIYQNSLDDFWKLMDKDPKPLGKFLRIMVEKPKMGHTNLLLLLLRHSNKEISNLFYKSNTHIAVVQVMSYCRKKGEYMLLGQCMDILKQMSLTSPQCRRDLEGMRVRY